MANIPHSQCRGPDSAPSQGTRSHMLQPGTVQPNKEIIIFFLRFKLKFPFWAIKTLILWIKVKEKTVSPLLNEKHVCFLNI